MLDYFLPSGDGRRVLELLRRSIWTSDIPVLVLSGSNAAERIGPAPRVAYLQKPAGVWSLTAKLSELLKAAYGPAAAGAAA